jgi:hypothetical protein
LEGPCRATCHDYEGAALRAHGVGLDLNQPAGSEEHRNHDERRRRHRGAERLAVRGAKLLPILYGPERSRNGPANVRETLRNDAKR